jgi:hypothetical protein
MTDVLLLSTVVVAFVVLTGLLRLCDRLVGPDPTDVRATLAEPALSADGDVAAHDDRTAVQP